MTTDEAIKFYGSQRKLAKQLGIEQGAVSQWGTFPPKLRQLQLQQLSKGRLKAEPGLLAVKAA